MSTSKIEVLVDFKDDQKTVDETLSSLRKQSEIKDAQFKNGSIFVETTLPSSQVLDIVTKTSGKRAVLQGFGETYSAVAMVSSQSCCKTNVMGVIRFQQSDTDPLVADGTLDGLTPGPHALHIHETGDISQGCLSLGPHFNPRGASHGAPGDPPEHRHAGDLGNIVAGEDGRATFRIVDHVLKVSDIVGRSVGVTEKQDDFGRGSSPTSKIDGDSGSIIACGVIARSAGIFQNPKRYCACDGVVVWDEKDRPLAGKGRRDKCCESGDKNRKPCCKV